MEKVIVGSTDFKPSHPAVVAGALAAANFADLHHTAADDARLIAHGYEPVAVAGKRPVADGWSTRPNTIEDVSAERTQHPYATNTGLRTGRLVGVDIDLHNPAHADAIKLLAYAHLGGGAMERVGSKGAMLCSRNETPCGKITVSGMAPGANPGDKPERVEILGTGQQFVAYGIHPDTGKPYVWPDADLGLEPQALPLAKLPEVTPEQLRVFARQVSVALVNLGYGDVKISDRADPQRRAASSIERAADRPVSREGLIARLSCLCDPHMERDDWYPIIAAIRSTNLRGVADDDMDGELLDIACAWSRGDYTEGVKPGNYVDDDAVVETFYSFNPDDADGARFGSIDYAARAAGFTGPPEVDLEKWQAFADNTKATDEAFKPAEDGWPSFASDDDLEQLDPPPVVDLIPGYVEKHRVAYFSGEGGLGKGRIALHWGFCVQTGSDLYGQAVEQATLVYISYENGRDEDARRRKATAAAMKLPPGALKGWVYCDRQGKGPLLDIGEDASVRPTELWAEIEAQMRDIPGHKFIVFDSAYNVFGFAGNSKINETAVNRAIGWLDNKMAEIDASGLMIMHPSSAGIARGDNSGWSVAWVNAPRVRLALKKVDGMEHAAELTVPKRNNAAKAKSRTLHFTAGLYLPDNDAGQNNAVYEACIEVATAACNGGEPITRGPKGNYKSGGWTGAVQEACGVRIGSKTLLEQLGRACIHQRLVYRQYDDNKRGLDRRAGFFPVKPKDDAETPQF